jgi:hypothetical protein
MLASHHSNALLARDSRSRVAAFTGAPAPPARRASGPRLAARCAAAGGANEALFKDLAVVLDNYKRAPPSMKRDASVDVAAACAKLKDAGALPKWGAAAEELPARRQVGLGELRMMGIKAPEAIAQVSVRNDAAFLISVVGVTSVAAVVLGQLPGDWGFWGAYGSGGICIVVLAIGSTSPGILQFAIDSFSQVFPDYRERVVRHEAAHFLAAHLLGVPVAGYSLMLGKEHTDLAEAALQRRLIEKQLEGGEVDRLSIIALAGATAEAMAFEEVMGQTADLMDLQRIMNRAATKLGGQAQQNQTRWAAYQAASLLKRYSGEYDALREAMARGATVDECVRAIEGC